MNITYQPVDLSHSILKVLAYFDLFDYPVSKEEIWSYLERPVKIGELSAVLHELLDRKIIFLSNGFYTIRPGDALAARRITGNLKAQALLRIAHRISHFLYQIPYVRVIGISGSLSKNFAAEDADIDYFIITKANRLWIARTIMHLFKKFSFLFGRQHWYCMNYYIDEEALEIEEKNIFTAIELITLLPVQGNGVIHDFFLKNDWAGRFYPNYRIGMKSPERSAGDSGFKKLLESFFDGRMGDRLDNYFMRVTTRRWKRKEEKQKLSVKGTRMSLYTSKHFSRPNPVFFQQEILALYNERLKKLSVHWDAALL